MRKNLELVKRTREMLGPDGDIMLDCWMAWTERYTIEMAEMLEPYKVYWMEECLQPHDYEGFGRLSQAIKSTRIVTGEHEYTRYGFRRLLENKAAAIWQPDINWCGGLTELRRIGALAAAYDIPVIPHGGGSQRGDSLHHGHHECPMGRNVHARAGRPEGSLRSVGGEIQPVERAGGHLHASTRSAWIWMGYCR